jgi:hypothetical protein
MAAERPGRSKTSPWRGWMLGLAGLAAAGCSDTPSPHPPPGPAAAPPAAAAGPADPSAPPLGPPAAPPASADLGAFADADLASAPREAAVYRVERRFVEPIMLLQGVPTFDQGLQLKAERTPLDRYAFDYFRLDDGSLAATASATVLRDQPAQFILSGPAVWYDRALQPVERGAFEDGRRHGRFERLDAQGDVVAVTMYDRGRAYDPARYADEVFAPLLGVWVHRVERDGLIDELVNDYREDGSVVIGRRSLMRAAIFGAEDDELHETSAGEPVVWSWRYRPHDATTGDIDYFDGLTLVARSRIHRPDDDRFDARITFHLSPELVNQRLNFRRSP